MHTGRDVHSAGARPLTSTATGRTPSRAALDGCRPALYRLNTNRYSTTAITPAAASLPVYADCALRTGSKGSVPSHAVRYMPRKRKQAWQ